MRPASRRLVCERSGTSHPPERSSDPHGVEEGRAGLGVAYSAFGPLSIRPTASSAMGAPGRLPPDADVELFTIV
jgi:hypothetical protein